MAFLPFIGPVFSVVDTVLKRVLPAEKMSEVDRARLEQEIALELAKADFSQAVEQIRVNLEEAKSQSVFVAGWRPFVGWTCGVALAYMFVLQPFLAFAAGLYRGSLPPLPTLDTGSLVGILMGMLGLGAMRTYEKIRGAPGR